MSNTLRRGAALALAAGVVMATGACTPDPVTPQATADVAEARDREMIDVGFVAVGPEGAWRTANEQDIQAAFSEEAGFNLQYEPALYGEHQSQVTTFHNFLDQNVDVILLSAVESEGWEQPLARARLTGVPVVLLDRGLELDDHSLYETRIAPDNTQVAQSVAEWAVSEFPDGANYFVLEGPGGASVVAERNAGWNLVMDKQPKFSKVGAQTANWSAEEATAVMAQALADHDNNIQLVFAHNDEMGLGAAAAVDAAGLTPGEDVKIATIDGTVGAMEALSSARINFVAEYNPLFGLIAADTVRTMLAGGAIDPLIVVPSATFDSPEAAYAVLPERRY